jgi:uncharacterized repeat protein (TIGR01451 family)
MSAAAAAAAAAAAVLQIAMLHFITIAKPPSVSLPIGTNGNYTITVNNTGAEPVTNVTVVEVLPPGLQFVSGPPGCSAVNQTVTCVTDSVLPNTPVNLPLVVEPVVPGQLGTTATMDDKTANTTVTVVRTCAVYNGDGSGYPCGPGTTPNSNNSDSTSPSNATCCVSPCTVV